jgi:HEAT repeat protein
MIVDLATFESSDHQDDLGGRRAEAAVRMLAHGKTAAGHHALIQMIARNRGRQLAWRFELNVFDTAHEHLARHGDAKAMPTLLHFLGTMTKDHRGHRAALEALPRIDATRARGHVFAIADQGIMASAAVTALAAIGDDDARARLHTLAQHPRSGVRQDARRALEAAGIDPGPAIESPLPETLVAHPDRDVRHDALRTLHDRKDRPLMLSLCAAEQLDALLRARSDDSGLPFSWYSWNELLPPEVPTMRRPAMMARCSATVRH